MRSLGVDPGRLRGAMALVDVEDGRVCVLGWAAWRDRTRKGERVMQIAGADVLGTLGAYRGDGICYQPQQGRLALRGWTAMLGGPVVARVAVEAARKGHGYSVSLDHHREVGVWIERVEARVIAVEVLTPQANDWRRALGIPVGYQARKGQTDARVRARLEPVTTWDTTTPPEWAHAHLWDAVGVAVFAAQSLSASARPAAIVNSTPG